MAGWVAGWLRRDANWQLVTPVDLMAGWLGGWLADWLADDK